MKKIFHMITIIMMMVIAQQSSAQVGGPQTIPTTFKTFEEFMRQPAMPVDPSRVISMPFAQRDTLQFMTTAEAVGLVKFLLNQNTSQYKLVSNGPNVIPFEKGVVTLYLDDNQKFHGSITPLKYMMLQNNPHAMKFLINSASFPGGISTVEF
jgi:hypothetical protein